jgi:hypothetical protein
MVTTATTHNLWMPLARRFATAVEDAEGKIARARVCVCVFFVFVWLRLSC